MTERNAGLQFVAVFLAMFILGFIAGAAAYSFKMFPYPLLRDAFLAADALYQKYVVYEAEVTAHPFVWAPTRRQDKGVTVYRPEKVFGGVNLVMSTHAQEAVLIDMDGKVVHKWALPFSAVWPDPPHVRDPVDDGFILWRAAHLYPNGDLLVIYVGEGDTPWGYGLVKMDKDSRVIWKYAERVHHDIDVDENGRIYTLTHGIERKDVPGVPQIQPPYIADFVVTLSPEGKELKKIAVVEALRDSDYAGVFDLIPPGDGDPLHTNTIEVVDRRIERSGLTFEKGQLLISMRSLSTIAMIDPESATVAWALRGPWLWQHDPDLLDNGNILIFDNRGHIGNGGSSRLVEFDPVTRETVWEYAGDHDAFFESVLRARQQRLPNGNTLVTESEGGRLFEVTADKEIVWEYVNPHRAGKDDGLIAWLLGGVRYDAKDLPFLETVGAGS